MAVGSGAGTEFPARHVANRRRSRRPARLLGGSRLPPVGSAGLDPSHNSSLRAAKPGDAAELLAASPSARSGFAGAARGVARDDNLAPVRALRSHRQACRLLTERPPRGRFVVELRRYGGCRMSGRPNLMGLFSVKRDGSSRLRRAASSVCDLDCAHSRGVVYAAPRCFGRRDAALAERPSDRQERRLWRAGRPDVR